MMERKIKWKGLKYQTQEDCILRETDDGVEVISVITGTIENKSLKLKYRILANKQWETYLLDLHVVLNGNERTLFLEKKEGFWLVNNVVGHRLDACVDIDISLTPFTNTLPIRRLVYNGHLRNEIEVVYIDIIANRIMPVTQYYTKISDSVYLYENEKTTFKAELKTDSHGLVIEYPNLFIEQ
jgi:hypothetical protein